MPSFADIAQQMRNALAVAEPELDTAVGTPTRKIIDAVSEVIAEGYVDHYLLDYHYDIESKQGTDLDDFVALFGFSRLPAKRATGSITFSRTTPAVEGIVIPVGMQVSSYAAAPVLFATVVPAMLTLGDNSVTVPGQALIGGTSGNVSPGTITRAMNPLEGITNINNLVAFIGGADPESDAQLRLRFKRTVFRNLAGTEQMFLGVALEDPDVTLANVIGSSKTFRESLQLIGNPPAATSLIVDAQYIYPNSSIFGPDIDAGLISTPGVHYSFNNANPPVVTSLDTTVIPVGIYELEFEYVPISSRNDPLNGITNRVDIYVNGTRAVAASETLKFTLLNPFNITANHVMNRNNFRRSNGNLPTSGNYFQRFAFGPVIDPATSDSIVIGATTYYEGVDFYLINQITDEGGTFRSLSGIEWISTANGATKPIPVEGISFVNNYVFNAIPRDVELAVRQWRLMTTDVRVHQAKKVRLKIHLAVIYSNGYSAAVVLPAIQQALRDTIDTQGFTAVLQASDILAAVHGVSGVDAVRFLTSTDNPTDYAIQKVSDTGTVLSTYATGGRVIDVLTADDEVPVFDSVVIIPKAENTIGNS